MNWTSYNHSPCCCQGKLKIPKPFILCIIPAAFWTFGDLVTRFGDVLYEDLSKLPRSNRQSIKYKPWRPVTCFIVEVVVTETPRLKQPLFCYRMLSDFRPQAFDRRYRSPSKYQGIKDIPLVNRPILFKHIGNHLVNFAITNKQNGTCIAACAQRTRNRRISANHETLK